MYGARRGARGTGHGARKKVHDRGEFEGRQWITMEYVDGTDAAELLKADGPLDPALALELVAGAGTALDYAWRKQQITHRDVKPANILVGYRRVRRRCAADRVGEARRLWHRQGGR